MAYRISEHAILKDSDGKSVLVAQSVKFLSGGSVTATTTENVLSPTYIPNYFTPFYAFQGDRDGYTTGGSRPTYSNTIEKFPFSTDASTIDVGDLSTTRRMLSGQSSATHGYTSGGQPYLGVIDKFPFAASGGNASNIGNLSTNRANTAGSSSEFQGYASGGNTAPPFTPKVTIDKFPFSSDDNASNIGNLTQSRAYVAGQSSTTDGYVSGGDTSPTSNVIDRFPFASDGNAVDSGDLTQERDKGIGLSSTTHGYTSGGIPSSGPNTNVNTIDKFPFASNGNASDVGDLTQARYSAAGQSSTTHGYTSGGIVYPPFAYRNTIDKFPFSSDTNATDVGDLLNNVGFTTGQQV